MVTPSGRRLLLFSLLSAAVPACPAAVAAAPAGGGARPDAKAQALKSAKTLQEALQLLGVQNPEVSPRLLLQAPDIVDGSPRGGARFAVSLDSAIDGTDWMALLVDGQTPPLLAQADFSPGASRRIEAQVRLQRTRRIVGVVRVGGKYYQCAREVKLALPAATGGRS